MVNGAVVVILDGGQVLDTAGGWWQPMESQGWRADLGGHALGLYAWVDCMSTAEHAQGVLTATTGTSEVEYRLLGPVEVLRDGLSVRLGPPKARALLGYLALHAGEVVSNDRLVDVLWAERPPASAAHALQVYVAGLRGALEPDRPPGAEAEVLRTRRPGYLLAVARNRVDVHRFEVLVGQGRRYAGSGRPERAVATLREGLALWRGGVMSDLAAARFVGVAAAHLEELRVAAVEDCVDAELAMGRHAEVVGELTALAQEHSLRERLHGQLMVALHRSGRQADALRVFRDIRQRLDAEGLTPGPAIQRLHLAILRREPGVAAPETPRGPAVAASAVPEPELPCVPVSGSWLLNRTVTVVHAIVVAAPRSDADLLAVMAQVPERLAACLRATGGTIVERGTEAITAVFGHADAHEDDAERAVRAALNAVGELGCYGREIAEAWDVEAPVVRIGVCTGLLPPRRDPPDGTDAGPVRAVALLADAAPSGAVLVDDATRRLVEDQFEWGSRHGAGASAVAAPRALSGKIRGLPGRAVGLVGRDDELAAGLSVVDAALAGTGGLLWLSGEVGLGKTRLLAELRRHAIAAPLPARWLQGNCLSYGQGVAYWPIRELVHEWLDTSMQAPELRVRARLRTRVDELLGPDVLDVHLGLAILLGLRLDGELAGRAQQLSTEATARITDAAVLTVLTRLAAQQPLIVAVEDAHWADASSLRVLEALLATMEDSAIAVLVTQRPERGHPSWQLQELARRTFAHRTTEMVLRPLAAGADAELLTALAGPQPIPAPLRHRLLAAAQGNPFFLEELVRSLGAADGTDGTDGTSRGDVEVEIPATIEQVLGSRIARLSSGAQQLAATAAVLGRQFSIDTLVKVMTLDSTPVEELRELTAEGVVVQTRGAPEAAYQFRHVLTQEAAYRSVWPPRRRELHRRAALVLVDRPGRSAASEGALARHWQLAGDDERAMVSHHLAARTAFTSHSLDVAAHHFRDGLAAARRLGRRADPKIRNDLLLGLGQVGRLSGAGDPETHLAEALSGAVATGDLDVEWKARRELGFWLGYVRGRHREALACFEAAARGAEQLGDVGGQVGALSRVSLLLAGELDLLGSLRYADRALQLAQDTGDENALGSALDARKLSAIFLGELRVVEELAPRLEASLRRRDELWMLQFVLAETAVAAAAAGRWTDAETRLAAAEEVNQRCGDRLCLPYITSTRAAIECSHGDYGSALASGRAAVAAAQSGGWWEPWARTDLGTTLLELHDLPAAIAQLDAAVATSTLAAQQVRSLAHLASAHWRAGARERAMTELHRAEALLVTVTAPPGQTYLFGADAALACAEVRLARGETERAEALLAPIVTAAEAGGWREPLARGLLLTGRCRQAAADAPRARMLAERALDVARDTVLPGVTWQAHAVLAGLSDAGQAWLGQARHGVMELSAALPDAALRTTFVEAALAEVDVLARAARVGPACVAGRAHGGHAVT